ncbi:hypothetical protein ACFFYR_29985 [Paraburkholderia dipogonis]
MAETSRLPARDGLTANAATGDKLAAEEKENKTLANSPRAFPGSKQIRL